MVVPQSAVVLRACQPASARACVRASGRGQVKVHMGRVRTQGDVTWCEHAQGMWEDTWRILNGFSPSLNLGLGRDGSLPSCLPLSSPCLPSLSLALSPSVALFSAPPPALSLVLYVSCAGAPAGTRKALIHEPYTSLRRPARATVAVEQATPRRRRSRCPRVAPPAIRMRPHVHPPPADGRFLSVSPVTSPCSRGRVYYCRPVIKLYAGRRGAIGNVIQDTTGFFCGLLLRA